MGTLSSPADLAQLKAPEAINETHRLEAFDCNEPELNAWLLKKALSNEKDGASRTFVLRADLDAVVGYYSLANGAVYRRQAAGKVRRNMPEPIPVMVLGRLAMDHNWHGLGLGKALLKDAIIRTLQAAKYAGIRAMLVHALSDDARRFYEKHRFAPSPLDPNTLMLLLKDAAANL